MDFLQQLFPHVLAELVVSFALWGGLALLLVWLVTRSNSRRSRELDTLHTIGIDPALLESLMKLDQLVDRASRESLPPQRKPSSEVRHDFELELLRTQARLQSLPPQARAQHEPFLNAVLHDASAAGLEVHASTSAHG